jgi:hypothetical protein
VVSARNVSSAGSSEEIIQVAKRLASKSSGVFS